MLLRWEGGVKSGPIRAAKCHVRFTPESGDCCDQAQVHTSKSLENVEFEKFTVSELADVQRDCENIYLRLLNIIYPLDQEVVAIIRRPWRHKSPGTHRR
jgi:hypothetical protein